MDGRDIWLKAGHAESAKLGKMLFNVDRLASIVGKSRSSFYHQFGDTEEYKEALLDYALRKTIKFSEKFDNVHKMIPDFVNLMLDHKDMVFFNKFIFLQRQSDRLYQETTLKISEYIDPKVQELWMELLNLQDVQPDHLTRLYDTIRTTGYMRLEYNNFSFDSITAVIKNISDTIAVLISKSR